MGYIQIGDDLTIENLIDIIQERQAKGQSFDNVKISISLSGRCMYIDYKEKGE